MTEHTCERCGKALELRMGKYGEFFACTGYPACRFIMNKDGAGNPVPAVIETAHKCGKCGSPMALRDGKRGSFLACTAFPKCRNAQDVDASGNPLAPVDLGVPCGQCGKPMALRRGPRGAFLGCTGYPKCRSALNLTPELKEQLKDRLPPDTPTEQKPEVAVTDECPKCGSPMKPRSGARGWFLGCTKYPACRGVKQPDEETLRKLEAPASLPPV